MSESFDYYAFMDRAGKAFSPFSPIDLVEMFQGRHEVIRRFEEEISSDGRHVILYGDRGVGKTSFANLAYFFARRNEEETAIVKCWNTCNFTSIFSEVLAIYGKRDVEVSRDSRDESATEAGFSFSKIYGKQAKKISNNIHREPFVDPKVLTPAFVVDYFKNRKATIIIDEYDRFDDEATDIAIAETIKSLSDLRSNTKIVIVGVAESVNDLVGQHSSLDRCCAQIHLPRMNRDEMIEIIDYGRSHVGLNIPFEVVARIVDMADGFPYFVHLIGLEMCRVFADRKSQVNQIRNEITREHFQSAIERAVNSCEAILQKDYKQATERGNKRHELAIRVLDGMALSSDIDVKTEDLAYNIRLIYRDEKISRQKFTSNITRLCGLNSKNILTKVRAGCYKFSDPRMRAFVRINLQRIRPSLFTGQISLPFEEIDSSRLQLSMEAQYALIELYSRIPNQTAESITYTDDFDALYEEFCRRTKSQSTKCEVWRALQNLRKAGRLKR